MSNLLEQALDSIIQGLEGLYLSDGTDDFVSSVLSVSSVSEKFKFAEFSAAFKRADAYLGALLSSHNAGTPLNGKNFVGKLNYLLSTLTAPKIWCENIYEDSSSTSGDIEVAYQLYDSYYTAVGNLRTCLDKVVEGDISVTWLPGTEPSSLPDIPKIPIINRKY